VRPEAYPIPFPWKTFARLKARGVLPIHPLPKIYSSSDKRHQRLQLLHP
jgi:hypothetical protein